jgi:hypothetical protein
MMETMQQWYEEVNPSTLKPHPRNYRRHPEDQLEHLMASVERHGIYRNIVIARDRTILAGHGVVLACLRLGHEVVPVHRLPIDPNSVHALEILAGDNEVDHLGEVDDRALTEILKEIRDDELGDLLGTGYDDQMLANLTFITRPAYEIADHNEAAHWVGMPEYEPENVPYKLTMSFDNIEERTEFIKQLELNARGVDSRVASAWWPPREYRDIKSVRFDESDS